MDEKRYTYRVIWLVLIGGGLLFLLFLTAWLSEGAKREWRKHQRDYAGILKQMEVASGTEGTMGFERGILQVELPQFNTVDRCISCHHGLEDERMKSAGQPHAKHPGTFLEDHPVEKYGCTICHGGQGRALNRKDAFGRAEETHWPHPLLEDPYIQASCGKCHLAIFDKTGDRNTDAREGMAEFLRGKDIFSREGCLGCHKARGVGGILGPDLTRQGEKTRHQYSFQHVSGEQTVSNWLKEHFRDPEMVSPGSQMLRFNLKEKELDALAIFVMGLARPDIPFDYFTLPTLMEFKGIRTALDGNEGYDYLCSACHGKKGEGKGYETYKTGIPAIGSTDFLRMASEEFIRFTMEKGRSLRQMGSWAGSVSGMVDDELDRIAAYLKSSDTLAVVDGIPGIPGSGNRGAELFREYCGACHGDNGSGGVALALNQPGFLERAGETFILETMLRGRGNTAMPGWSHLPEADLADLLALVRSWGGRRIAGPAISLPPADLDEGALRYHFLCSRCHGEFGEGETGPAIINRDFLLAADDRFLHETIAGGRAHTAMFGWSSDVYNKEKLGRADISNIIGFMRTSARGPLTYLFPGSNPGDRESGSVIYAARCAECHGQAGEGTKAPALNNQELLSAATNGFLMGTITIGRKGTAMPSWGYGEGDYPALSAKERQDLVAYIRSWQRIRIKY